MKNTLWFVMYVSIEAESCGRGSSALTSPQWKISENSQRLQKHLKRSIDLHRVSMGMVPFWNLDAACSAEQAFELQRRRKLNRDSQRRYRERKRKAKDGTPNG